MSIETKEQAKEAARWGYYAAFAVTFFTVLLLLERYAGLIKEYSWINYQALIDAALFLFIGFGIRKMSKTAAICGLILYVGQNIWKVEKLGVHFFTPFRLFWALCFLAAFVQGVRGTYAYHKLLNLESQNQLKQAAASTSDSGNGPPREHN